MLKAVNRVNDTRHPVAQRSSLGPTVTDVGISDDHSLTVLVQSSSPLESVDADLVEHGQVTSTHPLHIVSRYSRDGNSFLLAVFYSEEPLTPAVQVRLRSGSKTVSCESSRTHQTVDSTYPLIDRHHLITEIDGFRIESGMPRELSGPGLRSIGINSDSSAFTVSAESPITAATLTERTSGKALAAFIKGQCDFTFTAQSLVAIVPHPPVAPLLADITVDMSDGDTYPLVHHDPWVRNPRSVQIFTPMILTMSGWNASIRPYWTKSGRLALKVQAAR